MDDSMFNPTRQEVLKEMSAQRRNYKVDLPLFYRLSFMHKYIRKILKVDAGKVNGNKARCIQGYVFYIVGVLILFAINFMNPVTYIYANGDVVGYSGPHQINSYVMTANYGKNGVSFDGTGPAPLIDRVQYSNGDIKYKLNVKKANVVIDSYTLEEGEDQYGNPMYYPNWDDEGVTIDTIDHPNDKNITLLDSTNNNGYWGLKSGQIFEETHFTILLSVAIAIAIFVTMYLAIFTEDDTEEIIKKRKKVLYFKSTNVQAYNRIEEAIREARKSDYEESEMM